MTRTSEVLTALLKQRDRQSANDSHHLIGIYVDLIDTYLTMMEKTLTGIILDDPGYLPSADLSAGLTNDTASREGGLDWPVHAQTMVGIYRLRNIRDCMMTVLEDGIPGDCIETGVWRGGVCIYTRAILAAFGVKDRKVWVADSFEGLPPPDLQKYPQDAGDALHSIAYLAVSLEQVQENFRKYGMLDDQVVFLKGFFSDTLPGASIERIAILRLDGDMYGSTMDALGALYPKLSPGGFCIVDDYSLFNCASAVHDYRGKHGETAEIVAIDRHAAFWRKPV